MESQMSRRREVVLGIVMAMLVLANSSLALSNNEDVDDTDTSNHLHRETLAENKLLSNAGRHRHRHHHRHADRQHALSPHDGSDSRLFSNEDGKRFPRFVAASTKTTSYVLPHRFEHNGHGAGHNIHQRPKRRGRNSVVTLKSLTGTGKVYSAGAQPLFTNPEKAGSPDAASAFRFMSARERSEQKERLGEPTGPSAFYYDASNMPAWMTPPWITSAFRTGPLAYPSPGSPGGNEAGPEFLGVPPEPILPSDGAEPNDEQPISAAYANYPNGAIPDGRVYAYGQMPPLKADLAPQQQGNQGQEQATFLEERDVTSHGAGLSASLLHSLRPPPTYYDSLLYAHHGILPPLMFTSDPAYSDLYKKHFRSDPATLLEQSARRHVALSQREQSAHMDHRHDEWERRFKANMNAYAYPHGFNYRQYAPPEALAGGSVAPELY